MIKKASYWVSSNIWMSIEDYTNAGLTQEKAIEIVSSMPDPGRSYGGCARLSAERMGLNSNIIVSTMSNDPDMHAEIVFMIECRFDRHLRDMKKKEKEKEKAS